MPLPIGKLQFAGPQAIASYDYTDIAANTGIVNFYGGKTLSGAAVYYNLSNVAYYSDLVSTKVTGSEAGSYALGIEENFDADFIKPANVRGATTVNIPIGIRGITTSKTYQAYPEITVIKWDGTSGTNLTGSISGAELVLIVGGSTSTGTKMCAIRAEIPLTHFKGGETLRLNVKVYEKTPGSTSSVIFLGHDPQNRGTTQMDSEDFGTDGSILTFQVPFRIDI